MTIKGKAQHVPGFILVYVDGEPDAIYTIGTGTGGSVWARIKVGERASQGGMLTQELYDKWKSEATIPEASYTLTEEGDQV